MKNILWLGVAGLLLIAAYVLWQGQDGGSTLQSSLGTYPYACENGAVFTMTPADDLGTIQISAGSQGMFTGDAILAHMGDGPYFEGDHMGTLIVLRGAGEEVELSVGSETTICNPVPNPDSPPWNWGDPGEGAGSEQPDVRLVVGESIMGKWQSVDDTKFVREFSEFSTSTLGGTVADWYEGKEKSSGTYTVFTSEHPVEVAFPLMAGKSYIQMTMQGAEADVLNFSVDRLTPEALEMTYMDRGGVLRFTYIE